MSKQPLDGIIVLDFATVLAGPLVASFLGDFGADVIKVEMPSVKNQMGNAGREILNRNKRAITLDLHTKEGQDIAKRLCEKVDVVLFNFRPGVLEKWNLGPDILEKINPNLIICLVSAYGQSVTKPGFDRTVSAYSSITYTSGYPDHPPVRSGYPLLDYLTGYLGAFSVLLALYNRDANNTGGEVIDVSLIDAALKTTGNSLIGYFQSGRIYERYGNRIPFVVPAENFETKDGRFVAINANSAKIWKRLTITMDREDLLTSEEFGGYIQRVQNQDKLYEIIGDWVKQYTTIEITELLEKAEVPAELVRNIAEVAEDPELNRRGAIMKYIDPESKKEIRMPGIFPILKNYPGKVRFLGKNLGSDNLEIYRDLINLTETEIADLKKKGII